MYSYSSSSQGMTFSVSPIYSVELSSPEEHYYVWQCIVTVENNREESVRFLAREFKKINSFGKEIPVMGVRMVNKFPILKPSEKCEFTILNDLDTSSGIMIGGYRMISVGGKEFMVSLPPYSLDDPSTSNLLQ